MKGRLEGRTAVVTGGSSGIGAGIARGLSRAGANVVVNYHSGRERAEELAQELGSGAIAYGGDVSDEAAVAKLFDATIERFGRVDIVIANSGIQKDAPIRELSLEDWKRVLDVNLTGQFLVCREAVRRFTEQTPLPHVRARGNIVCISSVHEQIPWAGHINYAASKGGVMLMMKTLAQEVAPERIRVNGVAPGAIKTPINEEAWSDPEAKRKLLELIPYGRIGEPEDVAACVTWLASDESDYVTGASLFVDGGMTLYPGFADNG
ncbi:MAG: glucose 1-dehydrogenase [Polyangiales bacterium]